MDIPEPVFTLGPSEPKPEPPDVLIGCIKVDIYSQSSGVTGNVNEDVIRVNTPSKQDIIGTATDSQIPRLEGSKGTELPRQNDCQIFICEVCEEEFSEELFILNHKLVIHWMPIEMSLTHLPGHKTCGNCRRYLSESVEPNVAVFLTKTCQTCISGKCYTCEMCSSHFYLSDHFKSGLKLKLLNPKQQSDHTKNPKQKEAKEKPEAKRQQNSTLPKNPTKKPRQKKAKIIRTKTQVKADVKSKRNALDSAKTIGTPLESTPNQPKKGRRKERIPKKKDCVLCPQCGKTFAKRVLLTRHLKRHSDERPFICDVCKKSFTTQDRLTKHIRTHSDERPFLCDVCNKSFKLEKYLKQHQRQHTGEKPFTCGECGRGFARRRSFKYHCRTHRETKQFQCDRCPQAFHRNADLQGHIRLHHGTFLDKMKKEHRNLCDVCGKGFSKPYKLKIHLRNHTREFPYQCDACEKSFPDQGYLRKHIIKVHNEKTLPCPICNKMFSALVTLNRHRRMVHDAEKSFKCEECTMAFISQEHLDRHMYRHTGKSPHVCENCGRRFSTSTYCKAHQKKCY